MMKSLQIFILCMLLQYMISGQSVGIGTVDPDTSAILDLVSTQKGILIPRLTNIERSNIIQPKQGLLVYQKDGTSGFYVNRSTIPAFPNWSILSEGENLWSRTLTVNSNISANNVGNVGIGSNNPLAKLHVKTGGYGILHSDGSDNIQLGTYVGSNAGWFGTKSNHPLYFFTYDGTPSMTLTTQKTFGIGSNNPDTSAIADFISSTKGILLPRTSAISNITSPKDGMVIYNTSDNFMYLRKNNIWQKLSDDTNNAPFNLPYTGTGANVGDVFKITNSAAGRAIQGQSSTGQGIYGSSTTGIGVFGISSSGYAGQFVSTTGTAGYFSTNGPECLVTSGGNVGINTTSPTYFLDINGRTRIRHNSNTAGIWFNKANNTEAAFHGMYNDSIIGYFGNGTAGSWLSGFDVKNGRLGIGTMIPNMPISLSNSLGNKISLWGTNVSSHYGLGIDNSTFQMYLPSGDVNVRFAFGTGSATNFTELARLEADGQFLLGTNNSVYQTHFKSSNSKSFVIENSNNHALNVSNTFAFRTGGWYDALIRTVATSTNTARLGFFTYASSSDVNLLERMSITDDGDVLIGSTDETKGVGYRLRVNGKVIAEELKVQLFGAWPDYVFQKDYKKMNLLQLDNYINTNKHLPNIPSAKDIEKNGLDVGEMQRKMMEKIEELTLYLIELKKENEEIKKELHHIKNSK